MGCGVPKYVELDCLLMDHQFSIFSAVVKYGCICTALLSIVSIVGKWDGIFIPFKLPIVSVAIQSLMEKGLILKILVMTPSTATLSSI